MFHRNSIFLLLAFLNACHYFNSTPAKTMILSHFEGNCLQIRKIEERTGETIEGITACDTDLNHIPDQISNYVIGRRGEQLTKRIIFC